MNVRSNSIRTQGLFAQSKRRSRENMIFDWNNASNNEWPIIKRFFVAAYIDSYKKSNLYALALGDDVIEKSKNILDAAYLNQDLENKLIKSLQQYFIHEDLKKGEKHNITELFNKAKNDQTSRELLIKFIALSIYFNQEFEEEKSKIIQFNHDENKFNRIEYIIARYHNRPIGLIDCQLNYKTSKVDLRWVIVDPAFHGLGLGKMMLDKIAKRFIGTSGLELYTRRENLSAQGFYEHCGFTRNDTLNFVEPSKNLKISDFVLMCVRGKDLYLPASDATSHPDEHVGFSRKHSMRL